MAFATVSTLAIPDVQFAATAPAFTTLVTLNATGEQAAFIFRAPKTGAIRKLHFLTGAVTTATDTDVRLETVNTSTGVPTGTLFGTTTNVTVASGSITANTWIVSGNLTADASVTKGDLMALVIAPSGTPNYVIRRLNRTPTDVNFPYCARFESSAWTKLANPPTFAVEYSDGTFAIIHGAYPYSAINTHAINTGTTPDEIALKFKLSAPVRVCGAWFIAILGNNMDVVLYDSNGSSVLATHSVPGNVAGQIADADSPYYAYFTTSQELDADTFYYMALKPTSASSDTFYSTDVSSAAVLDQLQGGQNFHWAQQTNAGGWTPTTTRRPVMGLLIDGIDDGAGGGSGGGGHIIGGGF